MKLRFLIYKIKCKHAKEEPIDPYDKKDFMKWIKSPFPEVSVQNETPIDEFLWWYLLYFRDQTDLGNRLGYYYSSRNRAYAEAKIALQKLIKEESERE